MTKVVLNFTPETPFGIELYPYFEKLYNVIANRKASSFRFASSKTPLNTDQAGKKKKEIVYKQTLKENNTYSIVIIACITYFIVIFGGEWLMKNRIAFKPQIIFQIHNALLTLVSAGLLALIVEQVYPQIHHHGFLYAICSSKNWTQPLELLYYLNYLVKYWELLDTVFLVLKKKRLGKS